MTMIDQNAPRPSDKWIPWYFVFGFLIFITVDCVMAYLAISTNPGVVTESAYEHGLAYNHYLVEADTQKALGWQSRLTAEKGEILFVLKDAAGKPLQGAEVKVDFVRPSQAGHDFSAVLTETAPGQYTATPSFPERGLWNVRINATWQTQPYRLTQPLVIP